MRLAIVCVLSIAIFATPASAYWSTSGTGSGSGIVVTMPAGLQPTATSNGQNVTVTWPQSSFGGSPLGTYAGGGYKLTRYAAGGSAPVTPNASCATRISGAGATLQCIETGVSYGTWQYAVTPVLNSLTGPESANSTATNVVTAAPTLITATAKNPATGQTTGDIDLAWGTVTGATGYNVYRRVSGGSFDYGAPRNGATPVTATTYGDAGASLSPATTYDYVVRAVAGSPAVESASSGAVSAATISRPAAPAGVTATAALAARVDEAWASVGGAVGYNVYRTSTGVYDYASPLNGATPVATPAYSDLTAVNAVTYRYVVRSVILGAGGARVESASSIESAPATADDVAPQVPTDVLVTSGGPAAGSAACGVVAGTRYVNANGAAAMGVAANVTAEAGQTIIFSTTGAATATSTVAAAGTAAASTLDVSGPTDGTISLTAQARDLAGNTSAPSVATTAVKDTVAALTASYNPGLLFILLPSVSGTAECGATVHIVKTSGGTGNWDPSVDGSSPWRFKVSGGLLTLGPASFDVTTTDPAGNTRAMSIS